MSGSAIRLIAPAHGCNPDALVLALKALMAQCEASTTSLDVVLLVPSKSGFADTQMGELLGNDAKELLRGGKVSLPNNSKLRLESEDTYKKSGMRADVVLTVYGGKESLDLADGTIGAKAVISVPWTMEAAVLEWVATWSPTVLGSAGINAPALTLSSVVEKAMKSLTQSVNLSTGVGHPMDKATAVSLFKAMDKKGIDFDPAALRAWAIRNGWKPSHADDLRSIAEGVREGKSFRTAPHKGWSKKYTDTLLTG